jgi:hypothetical protein
LAVAAREKKRFDRQRDALKAESLWVHKEIASLAGLPFAFAGIPFGASKRAFIWMANRAGFEEIQNNGSYFIGKRVPFGNRSWLGAFYFDTLGLCRYELEGVERPADSLDDAVRSEAHYLATLFEERIGSRPHQTNRVNRDEVVQDELAIVNAWSQSAWSVAIGLSRHNFRYYAKAVATNRPLPVK